MPFDAASSWNSTPSVDWGGTLNAFKDAKPTDYLPYASERGKYAWGQDPGPSSGDKWGNILRLAGTALQDYNNQKSGAADYAQYGGGAQKVGDLTFVWPTMSGQPSSSGSKVSNTIGGALSGAGTGFMIGGPIGAAVGGVAGGLGGLFS